MKSFQTWAWLNVDGKTGYFTWRALDNAFATEGTTDNYIYYNIGSNDNRMAVKKSNHQAYIRKPNNYWVRVDAWRSTGTTTWPS